MSDIAVDGSIESPTAPARKAARASTSSRLVRGSSLLLIGRLVSLSINFAVQVLTVRYLTKHDYGAFAYGMGVVSTGATAVLLGLDKAVPRFIPLFQERGEPRRIFGTIVLATSIIWGLGLSMVVLLYGLRATIGPLTGTDPLSVSLLLILIALVPISAYDSLLQRLMAIFVGVRAIFFRRHLLGPGLKLAVVLLVILTAGSVHALAVGYVIGGMLGLALYVAILARAWRRDGLLSGVRLRAADVPTREVLGYSLPLLSSELVLVLRDSLAVILLGYFQTTREVAEYQSVLPMAKLNLVVVQSFSLLFLPMAARLFARQDRAGMNELYWQTTLWIAVLSFPVFAATSLLAPPLITLFFGARYADSASILAVLAIGHYFHASLGFNALTLRIYGKIRYILVIDLAAVVTGVALHLLLIPRYGALGAAVGTTATFIVHNILNNVGLAVGGTGVRLLYGRFLGVFAVLAATTVGMFTLKWLLDPPLYVEIVALAALVVLVIRGTRRLLRPAETFPELLRIPFLRRLVA